MNFKVKYLKSVWDIPFCISQDGDAKEQLVRGTSRAKNPRIIFLCVNLFL